MGLGAGWLEAEFAALGVPYAERGARTDEVIDAMRACWGEQPVSFEGPTVAFQEMRIVPRPAHTVPIWIGGTSGPARRRAAERGDGWHGNVPQPEKLRPIIEGLRAARPEPDFVISLRVGWDGLAGDLDDIRRMIEVYDGIGVQHVVAGPVQTDLDNWLTSVERLWAVVAGAAT